jgi:hypothetical protein
MNALARWVAALLLWAAGSACIAQPRSDAVVLYASPTTRAVTATLGGRYDVLLTPWRQLFAARRIAVQEIADPAALARLSGGVLVLPSAVALSAAERQALLRFRRAGGSILATWAVGVRDEQGRWLGHDFARELLDVRVAGEVDTASQARFLVPFGDLPVNRSVPAGRRIWLGQLAEKPLWLQGGQPAAAYLDWSRTVLREGEYGTAVVYDEDPPASGGGRRVVFGFAETAWDFQPADVQALAADVLQWLRRQPAAHLAAWPHGRRAAQVIAIDTEEGFGNAAHFARMLDAIGVRGTLYCLTSEARRHGELLRKLVGRHEVAFHGEVHVGFAGLARDKQRHRLQRMLDEMASVLGRTDGWPSGAGRGFRAPTEGYDATTEALLHEMGLGHHAADPNSSGDRLPHFAPRVAPAGEGGRGLVVLPRGQLDDLNYLQMRLSKPQIAAALVGEYEFNLALGGFALLSVHSQSMAHPEQLLAKPLHNSLLYDALQELTRHIARRGERVWVAPAGEMADWWRARARAAVSARARGAANLELVLAVQGDAPVSGLTVLLARPAGGATAVLQSTDEGAPPVPPPELRALDRDTMALVFGAVPPGRHVWRVTWR